MLTESPIQVLSDLLLLQGYVCPGYLVTRTDTENINILQDNWTAHSLVSPPQYKIITVGLSQPCTMAPFTQVNHLFLSLEKHFVVQKNIIV